MQKNSRRKHVSDEMWDHLGILRWEYGKSVKEIAKDHKHVCTMSTIYRLTEEWYLLGGVRNPKQMSGGDCRSKMTIEHRNLLFTPQRIVCKTGGRVVTRVRRCSVIHSGSKPFIEETYCARKIALRFVDILSSFLEV